MNLRQIQMYYLSRLIYIDLKIMYNITCHIPAKKLSLQWWIPGPCWYESFIIKNILASTKLGMFKSWYPPNTGIVWVLFDSGFIITTQMKNWLNGVSCWMNVHNAACCHKTNECSLVKEKMVKVTILTLLQCCYIQLLLFLKVVLFHRLHSVAAKKNNPCFLPPSKSRLSFLVS
jgi:hypothetical protein